MRRTRRWVSTLSLLQMMTIACGRGDGRSGQEGQNSGTPSSRGRAAVDPDVSVLLDDAELAGDAGSSLVDEAISEAAEELRSPGPGGLAFFLAGQDSKAALDRFRKCEEDTESQSAVVTVKRAAQRKRTVEKFNRKGTSELSQLLLRNETWSKPDATIECRDDGKHADIRRQDLQGVQLSLAVERTHSQSSTMTHGRKNTSFTRSRSVTAKGTRAVTWTEVKTVATNLVLTKSVQSEITRTVETVNKSGEKKSFSTTVKTDATAPLVITVERKSDDETLISRTIVSGKKVATFKSGGRLETVFQNVKYEPDSGCYAVSGTVEGALFDKDAQAATQTFTMTFTGDTKVMVFKNADGTTSEVEYVAEGCDFDVEAMEETSDLPREKTSEDEVKLPS